MRTRLITEAALEQEKTPEGRQADARYRFTRNNGGKIHATESLNRSAQRSVDVLIVRCAELSQNCERANLSFKYRGSPAGLFLSNRFLL
jgi:hypothetical protein